MICDAVVLGHSVQVYLYGCVYRAPNAELPRVLNADCQLCPRSTHFMHKLSFACFDSVHSVYSFSYRDLVELDLYENALHVQSKTKHHRFTRTYTLSATSATTTTSNTQHK